MMKRLLSLCVLLISSMLASAADEATFVTALQRGKPQTIVAYGTSLTAGGAWVAQMQAVLDKQFPKLATVINSGMGAQGSTWGLANLDERVIAKKPDAVIMEFSINDADLPTNAGKMTASIARRNLEAMIRRILAANARCEIILMVMNPPTGVHLQRRPDIQAYDQVWREVAKERGLRLIDHSAHWRAVLDKGMPEYLKLVPDGVHPNASGCSEIILPHLLRSLGLKAG